MRRRSRLRSRVRRQTVRPAAEAVYSGGRRKNRYEVRKGGRTATGEEEGGGRRRGRGGLAHQDAHA
jgi:hypothetical protein